VMLNAMEIYESSQPAEFSKLLASHTCNVHSKGRSDGSGKFDAGCDDGDSCGSRCTLYMILWL
jgi:hypothetical protein